MLGVIAGHDTHDPASLDAPVPDYRAELARGVGGLRLGVDRDFFFYRHVAPDVRAAVEAAIKLLESLGAEIVDVRLPELAHAVNVGMAILLADTSEWHRRLLRSHGDKYVPATRIMLELGEMVLGRRRCLSRSCRSTSPARARPRSAPSCTTASSATCSASPR
jgi:aspartyl-tRNA(Asn)/glutamyl-tRNA(Gln) amidotransferase subunit A